MKKRLQLSLTIGMLLLCITGMAHATLLTFDEIATDSFIQITNYGGLNWGNTYVINGNYHPGTGYQNGIVSGNNAAFNGYGAVSSASGSTFDFNSAYLTSAWNNGNTVTLTGYLNGTQMYQTSVVVNTDKPNLFEFNFYGIDSLTFTSSSGQFVMDNATINSSPVPVPPAFILFGSGLAGLAGIKLRGKKQ